MKVETIAELMIKLQESGFIDYTHYTLTFGCSQYKRKETEDHISKLESTLLDWKKSVQIHRKKYPQLNYYTSQQLLDLQKELGKLKKCPQAEPSCKLMLLLLSITVHPYPDKISRAIQLITSKSSDLNAAASTKSIIPQHKAALSSVISAGKKRLNVSDLGEEEKEIYKTLTSEDDYSPLLVLQAFEKCLKGADEESLRLWCMDNESSIEKDEEELFVPDDVSTEQQQQDDDIVEVTADDPLVQELLEEEYELNIAIEAVKLSKTMRISAQEAVLSLDLGKSPQMKARTGWLVKNCYIYIVYHVVLSYNHYRSIPSKYTHVPFTVKMDVPRDEYLSLVELGEVLKELACTIGETEGNNYNDSRDMQL